MSKVFVSLLAVALLTAAAPRAPAFDVKRPEIRDFINRMASKNHFKKRELRKLLKAAQTQPAIIDAMNRPAEKVKQWFEYRAIFLTDTRIQMGREFWLAHSKEIDQAAADTGVAPEYLVAILGVETKYGKQTGRYRVIDSLSTLAFDYPQRSKYFLSELEQFLLMSREAKVDPALATGSYAGAMGAPQFMPSSYRRYGVDASKDGHIDLWTNWLDVLVSVGNYFKANGWVSGEPIMAEAQRDAQSAQPTEGRKLALDDTVASLRMRGVAFETTQPGTAPALLIAADYPDGIHWRVGFKNFYVITRYNHSALYTMAVTELAGAVKRALDAPAGQPATEAVPGLVPSTPPTPGLPPPAPPAVAPGTPAPSATPESLPSSPLPKSARGNSEPA